MENIEEKKRGNGLLITIIVILLLIIAFFGGFFVKGLVTKDKEKETPKEEEKVPYKEKETLKEKEKKDNIPVTDKFLVNLYANGTGVYIIDNGDLYFLEAELIDESYGRYFLLTHSGCMSNGTDEYCKGNPIYSKMPDKIEGISNVVRIKLFSGHKSGGESFQVYAITASGDVYEINDHEVGELVFTGVEDMVGNDKNGIVLKLKDGTSKNADI